MKPDLFDCSIGTEFLKTKYVRHSSLYCIHIVAAYIHLQGKRPTPQKGHGNRGQRGQKMYQIRKEEGQGKGDQL